LPGLFVRWTRAPREARRELRSLSRDMQGKVMKAAARAAAKPAKKVLKGNTPVAEGDLVRSVGHKQLSKTAKARVGIDPENVALLVGPTRKVSGVKQTGKALLVEIGTKFFRGRRFIERSQKESEQEVGQAFYQGFDKQIDKYRD